MKVLLMIAAISTVALVGCAANTGIVKISEDTYMYGKQAGWEQSGAVIKVGMYKEANEFCSKMGKKFVQVANSSSDQEAGKFSAAEIQFKCE
ncbi:MAG: hypothetical protein HOO90_00990 [Methylotenera sp.]|uniref:hypothetical protein n=1 Tax=Methylotenera sp. TaxID=2051956 RepID=UPI0017964851|nr:hypothetical protein [Methylotenera sp.]NOU24091.1 hypothetical protein [Methylotenera sp.]